MSRSVGSGRRAAAILILLGLAASSSACFLARVGPALGRLGEAGRARALAQQIELPGRTIHQGGSHRCGVNHGKFDEFVCSSSEAKFAVTRGSVMPVWAELDEQLVLAGWTSEGAGYYTRRGFGGGLWLFFDERVLQGRRADAARALLEQTFANLDPGELLIGAVMSYQTPSDVLRSHTCWSGC